MGLTKQYLRFVPGPIFGIIGNSSGKILFSNTLENETADHVIVSACENVIVWNCRTSEKVCTLYGEKYAVSTIAQEFYKRQVAVGYADGFIRIFDVITGNCLVSFSGHKSAVSCLAYDSEGFRLASGGMDTDIIVWDILNEAGMFSLKGHKGVVTQCQFLKQKNFLISCSKDSLVKFWDLDAQHCFKTVVGNNNEVWDLVVLQDSRLLVGNRDGGIDVFDLCYPQTIESDQSVSKKLKTYDADLDEDVGGYVKCIEVGKVPVDSEGKKISFDVDSSGRLFGYHTYGKYLQLFKILNNEEIKKKSFRRKRKERKRQRSCGDEDNIVLQDDSLLIQDQMDMLNKMKFPHNIASFSIRMIKSGVAKIVILFINNSISLYEFNVDEKHAEPSLQHSIAFPGHRTDVRTLSFSSDSLNILSASADCLKIWNRDNQKCIATIPCDYALCSFFAPGNKYCVIGSKSGKIQIFDIAANILLEDAEAHDGAVSCMCLTPDQFGFASGGKDKNVKFWVFDLIKDEKYSNTNKRLSISAKKVLQMDDEVLCVKFSPDNRNLAVSLLDFQVKVFFVDTLKFRFALHGHKLPVCSLDISYDGSLIVTGSADRNVKIWSTEFGCCNKSIFAHEEGIYWVQFLPKTHMFFTAGKDRKIKQWDADNFQKIITLEGHQSNVYSLSISPDGFTVASTSNDKSLRLWEKTSEPLVLEEEQEIEREAEINKDTVSKEDIVPGEINKDICLTGKKNIEVVKSVDQLVETIDIYQEEICKLKEHEQACKAAKKELPLPDVHPLLKAFSTPCPVRFMLEILRKVKSSDLEQTLLLLPFNYAIQLLEILTIFFEKKWDTELCYRCLTFLVRIHLGQITASQKLYTLLYKLRNNVDAQTEIRDALGFNLAALRHLKLKADSCEEVCLFAERYQQKKTRKRKKLVTVLKSGS